MAVILLASVTVGIVATAYYRNSTLTKETAGETGKTIEHEFDVMGAKLKVDVFADCKIYLRNAGTKDVPIPVIKKDAVQEIIFSGLSTGVAYISLIHDFRTNVMLD